MAQNKNTILSELGVEIDASDLDPAAFVDMEDDSSAEVGYVPFVATEKLAFDERETSITQTGPERRDGTLKIFTNDPVWINRLIKRGYTPTRKQGDSHFFNVDARALRLMRADAIGRASTMTEEQREAARERMKVLRESQRA